MLRRYTPLKAKRGLRRSKKMPVKSLNTRRNLRWKRGDIPHSVRQEVLLRSGGRCEYCGAEGTELHHRLPRSRGGRHTADNLVLLCTYHHMKVHANPRWAHEQGLLVSAKLDAMGEQA